MRILLSNPDTLGDLILRQPLLAALLADGHQVALAVRTPVLPLARLVAPGATLLEIPFDPYAPEDRWRDQSARLLREAARLDPDVLALAPFQRTVLDEKLAAALPRARLAGFRGRLFRGDPALGIDNVSTLPLDGLVEVEETARETEKNAALAAAILGRTVTLPAPSIDPTAEMLGLARERLSAWGFAEGGYVIACVGHSDYTAVRNWGLSDWASVLADWAASKGQRFILVGSDVERPALEEVRGKLGAFRSHAVVSAGDGASLELLAGLTRLSAGYIGRDTGPMHLAAACGKPVIAVFGGGTWPRFLPAATPSWSVTVGVPCVGCDWVCHLPESYCVKRVPVDDVSAAIADLDAGRLAGAVTKVLDPGPALNARLARESAVAVRECRRDLGRMDRMEALVKRSREIEIGEAALRRELSAVVSELSAATAAARDTEIREARAVAERTIAFEAAAERTRERDAVAAALRRETAEKERIVAESSQKLEEITLDRATIAAEKERELEEKLRITFERDREIAEKERALAEKALVSAERDEARRLAEETARKVKETERDLITRIDALGREVSTQQGRVGALVTSRWRKLGRISRLAKPFPWESEY